MVRNVSLLSVALAACALLGSLNAPAGVDTGQVAVANAWLTNHLVLLAGGWLLQARWSVTREPAMAWLATAFLVPSVSLVPIAMLQLAEHPPTWVEGINGPLDVISSVVVLVLVTLVARKHPFPATLNPIGLAALVAAPSVALAIGGSSSSPPALVTHALAVAMACFGTALVLRLRWLQLSHRIFLVLGIVGLTVAHDFHGVAARSSVRDLDQFAVAGVGTFSAVVIVVLTLGLFRRALDLKAQRLAEYEARAATAEEWQRRQEELMHEVRATIAAISNATYILNGDLKPKSPLAEQELRTMLEAEVDRVQRMLCRTDPGGPCRIDLDQLVRAQVIAQRALGHDVCWEPSGVTAYGHSDKLAEALHVVLTNATRYAAGAPVEVTTGVWRDMASITVTDSGPGVAAELRATVFDRGVHEDDSPGEGIGLYVARNSVEADGGSITLTDPVPGRGAQFVIRMPCKVTEDA